MEHSKGSNYGKGKDEDQEFLKITQGSKILKKGYDPIAGPGYYAEWIYYENSTTYRSDFYISACTNSTYWEHSLLLDTMCSLPLRKAEENRVWAGMAKETAHQLGTPISAIIGWIEHLKGMSSQ